MNYCGKCGYKIDTNNIICKNCGNIISKDDEYNVLFLEKLRIKTLKKYIIICVIFYVLFISRLAYAFYTDFVNTNEMHILEWIIGFAGQTVFFLFFAVSCLVTRKSPSEYIKIYKHLIVNTCLKKIFTDYTYEPNKGIQLDVITKTKMIFEGDYFSSNDYIEGKYKNVSFKSSDILVQEKDSEGSVQNLFKGQWMIFKFNKPFLSSLQVCEKNFPIDTNWGLERVYLEDEHFNNIFSVYAKNPTDAFYILTPHNIEKILQLNNYTRGALILCFIGDELHIGLDNNNDLFEPHLLMKTNLERDTKKTIEELKIITSFIDILNLDNDLFRKEV